MTPTAPCSDQPATRAAKCAGCGADYRQPFFEVLGVEVAPSNLCDDCGEEAERDERLDLEIRRLRRFREICPPEFADSDPARFPSAWHEIRGWQYGPRGIGLIGVPGTCKTRMLWAVARRVAVSSGTMACNLPHGELEYLAQHKFEGDNAAQLRRYRHCKLLILDDFAKGALKGASLRALFDIVDHRTSHNLPILWTSNLSGAALKRQFNEDDWTNYGLPLCGRLAEFCDRPEVKP